MLPKRVDLIWNITLVCPWNCEFCCTDAVHVTKRGNEVLLNERGLQDEYRIPLQNDIPPLEILRAHDIRPNMFDIALAHRQLRGHELTYEQKIQLLNNIYPIPTEIDFSGGDPLACYENYLVVKEAARLFGKEGIAITATGAGLSRYSIEELSDTIGQFEFTFDERIDLKSTNRPNGYNKSNIHVAKKFSSLGVRTKAQLPIHNANTSTSAIEAIYLALHDAKIDELLLMRTFPVGRGTKDYTESWQLTRDVYKSVIHQFRKLEKQYGKPKIRLQCALRFLEEAPEKNPCDLMHESFGINPQGLLLLSAWATNSEGNPLDKAFVLGDLSKHKISALLSTDIALEYARRLDDNFGHCKIFAFVFSKKRTSEDIFSLNDPLYSN